MSGCWVWFNTFVWHVTGLQNGVSLWKQERTWSLFLFLIFSCLSFFQFSCLTLHGITCFRATVIQFTFVVPDLHSIVWSFSWVIFFCPCQDWLLLATCSQRFAFPQCHKQTVSQSVSSFYEIYEQFENRMWTESLIFPQLSQTNGFSECVKFLWNLWLIWK